MKVLLDANFLMLPNQFGIDIFEYLNFYDLFTLSSIVKELSKISKQRGKDGKAAKVALDLLGMKGIRIVETNLKGDKAIISYALKEKCKVATNDQELMSILKKNGIKIIRMKQKKFLEEE